MGDASIPESYVDSTLKAGRKKVTTRVFNGLTPENPDNR
jgi:hypothetical protein